MKLNNEKNIVLCEKALYVKQLEYYAKMCNVYAQLAEKVGPTANPELVQQKYSRALSAAAYGDIDIIRSSRLSADEKNLLINYSQYAGKLQEFKEASAILCDSLTYSKSHREARIDSKQVQSFKNYMEQGDKSTKAFMDKINVSTPTLIGHEYFVRANTARRSITDIDSNHIPQSFNKDFTPSAFGAEITGFKIPVKEIVQDSKTLFDKDETTAYRHKPNSITEGTKVVANALAIKAGQAFKGNKKTIRRAIGATLLAAAVLGSVNHFKDVRQFNDLNVRTNIEQGYDVNIENDTKKELSDIRTLIENYQKSGVMPSEIEMSEIQERLDNGISSVVSDLVTDAYKDAHPDYSNISVVNKYDKTTNQYLGDSSEPNPESFINVTYTDKNGEEHTDVITKMGSVALTNNPLAESFDNEYKLDTEIDSKIASIYSENSTLTFKEKSDSASELLNKYMSVLEKTEHLAGTKVKLNDLLSPLIDKSVSTDLPDKSDDSDAR